MFRKPVSKAKSANQFRSQTARTKSINLGRMTIRGGFRL